MRSTGGDGTKGGGTAGVLLAGAVCLLALPSAVLAFSADFVPAPQASPSGQAMKQLPDDPAAGLGRPIPVRSLAKGQLYLFTPAKTPNRPDRSVTVAVRVDPFAAKGISVLGRREMPTVAIISPLRI